MIFLIMFVFMFVQSLSISCLHFLQYRGLIIPGEVLCVSCLSTSSAVQSVQASISQCEYRPYSGGHSAVSFTNFFLSLIVFTVCCLLSGLVRVGLGQVVGVGGVVVGSATAAATTVVDLTPDIIFILL